MVISKKQLISRFFFIMILIIHFNCFCRVFIICRGKIGCSYKRHLIGNLFLHFLFYLINIFIEQLRCFMVVWNFSKRRKAQQIFQSGYSLPISPKGGQLQEREIQYLVMQFKRIQLCMIQIDEDRYLLLHCS